MKERERNNKQIWDGAYVYREPPRRKFKNDKQVCSYRGRKNTD